MAEHLKLNHFLLKSDWPFILRTIFKVLEKSFTGNHYYINLLVIAETGYSSRMSDFEKYISQRNYLIIKVSYVCF